MWKIAMRKKAPRAPAARAIVTGTPILGSERRSGLYARLIHGAANTLCHVSDLNEYVVSECYC